MGLKNFFSIYIISTQIAPKALNLLLQSLFLLIVCIPAFTQQSARISGPTDPFVGIAPAFDAKTPEATKYNVGDWGVSEQRGAATYTYSIDVPPGRNGMSPSLVLRYSSNSPLRGGIAVGWTLDDLPSIELDLSLRIDDGFSYKATLGAASGRLIEVADKSPYPGRTFRIDYDESFTRFIKIEQGGGSGKGPKGWVALTSDGVTHFFEERELPSTFQRKRWYITRQVDPFGNTIRYYWDAVRRQGGGNIIVDLSLNRIEYTSNETAGLDAHAKVEFSYAPREVCSYSNVPIGATPSSAVPWTLEGTQRLIAIKTHVRDEPNYTWRLSKNFQFDYQLRNSTLYEPPLAPDPPPPDIHCLQNPLRYLTQIKVTAYDQMGTSTESPPITFKYNYRLNTIRRVSNPFGTSPMQEQTIEIPGFAHHGNADGALSTLLDIDSDGIPDLVSVVEEDEVCILVWQKGLFGGGYDMQKHKSPLPTFPWYYQTERQNSRARVSQKLPEERCTVNGQITFREKYHPRDEFHHRPSYSREKIVYGYHFMDYTGDGRLDLIVTPNLTSSTSGFLDDYPSQLPLPVGVTVTDNDAPNNYVWWLYHNASEKPEYNQLHGIESVFSVQAFTIAAPVPLPQPGSEAITVGFQVPIKSLPPPLFDLNNDGFLDAIRIGRSGATNTDCEGIPVNDSRSRWCVYFGQGGQTFSRGNVWYVPWNSDVGAFSKTNRGRRASFRQNNWTVAGLYDVNGDGLSDFVYVQQNGMPQAWINYGTGFAAPTDGLGYTTDHLDKTQTDLTPRFGYRGYRKRIVDLDGDGLLDEIIFAGRNQNINTSNTIFARFNIGDRFGPRVQLPSVWLSAKRLFSARRGNWQMNTDFMDVTGDGLRDLVKWNRNTLTYIKNPGLPMAPGRLRTIENGRGLRIELAYAPTTDPDIMRLTKNSPTTFLPNPMWVTSSVTVSGGHGTPTKISRFQYENPVFMRPTERLKEPSRFLGFDKTTLTTTGFNEDSTGQRVTHLFAYDKTQGEPKGRLIKEWIHEINSDSSRLHKYTETKWKQKALFAGKVMFTHRDLTLIRTCDHDTDEDDCETQTENVHRIEETWVPWVYTSVASSLPNGQSKRSTDRLAQSQIVDTDPNPPQPLLYLRKSVQEGSGIEVGELDRVTKFDYQVRYGQRPYKQGDYRILKSGSESYDIQVANQGIAYNKVGQIKTHYDQLTGLPLQLDKWLNDSTIARTKQTFDTSTGNLLTAIKPEQAKPGGSGKNTTYAYDDHKIYVQSTIKELGHKVITNYDMATGVMIEQKGPNFILQNAQPIWDKETWQIDGFGRELEHAISIDDDQNGYSLETISKTAYFDFEAPNRVMKQQLRDFGSDFWIKSEQTFDGLGRVLQETEYLAGDGRAVTRSHYNSIGNLAAIDVPDPRTDDGSSVKYTYLYDGLGRLIQFIRPDSSGVAIAYAGLDKVVEEVTRDNTGAKTKQVFDMFDRLIEIHEFNAPIDTAVTKYKYDSNDNLIQVTDAENNLTVLAHDWVGNRTQIVRGSRVWEYEYDNNSNMVAEISPMPNNANPIDYKNLYTFDDLNRINSSTPASRGMSSARQSELGIGLIRYEYDTDSNGIGRLVHVDLPFGNIKYQYNSRGLIASEEREFDINHGINLSDSQKVIRHYNALGNLTLSEWDDGQKWRTSYDERGLVATVQWFDPQMNDWQNVADYERSLAGQIRTRNTSFGQVREFIYDILGRPIKDLILKPAGQTAGMDANIPNLKPVSTRSYTYSDAGNINSISGNTADFSADANFTYDAMHRIKSANGPNGYSGAFSYSSTGNIKTANVSWNNSAKSRNVRYAYGSVDPQAVDRLENIVGSGNFAEFNYDISGNMIKRIAPNGTWSFVWDGENQLREAQGPIGTERYYYDHNSERLLAITSGDSVRFWFGESETHYNSEGEGKHRYLHLSNDGSAVARAENSSKIELQYADALQNLIVSLDRESNFEAKFSYGVFGEVVQTNGEDDHRRQYNGKESDIKTGLRYYGYRYYDPLVLRWNSADPLYRFAPDVGLTEPQRTNLYAFSLNNPLIYYDPNGQNPLQACASNPTCAKAAETTVRFGKEIVVKAVAVLSAAIILSDSEKAELEEFQEMTQELIGEPIRQAEEKLWKAMIGVDLVKELTKPMEMRRKKGGKGGPPRTLTEKEAENVNQKKGPKLPPEDPEEPPEDPDSKVIDEALRRWMEESWRNKE